MSTNARKTHSRNTEFDNCPVFEDLSSVHSCLDYPTSSGASGNSTPNSRCFMLEDDPFCLRVKCADDGKSYRFETHQQPRNTFTCYEKGPIHFQSRGGGYRKLDCENPKIVCGADLNPFHLVPRQIFDMKKRRACFNFMSLRYSFHINLKITNL